MSNTSYVRLAIILFATVTFQSCFLLTGSDRHQDYYHFETMLTLPDSPLRIMEIDTAFTSMYKHKIGNDYRLSAKGMLKKYVVNGQALYHNPSFYHHNNPRYALYDKLGHKVKAKGRIPEHITDVETTYDGNILIYPGYSQFGDYTKDQFFIEIYKYDLFGDQIKDSILCFDYNMLRDAAYYTTHKHYETFFNKVKNRGLLKESIYNNPPLKSNFENDSIYNLARDTFNNTLLTAYLNAINRLIKEDEVRVYRFEPNRFASGMNNYFYENQLVLIEPYNICIAKNSLVSNGVDIDWDELPVYAQVSSDTVSECVFKLTKTGSLTTDIYMEGGRGGALPGTHSMTYFELSYQDSLYHFKVQGDEDYAGSLLKIIDCTKIGERFVLVFSFSSFYKDQCIFVEFDPSKPALYREVVRKTEQDSTIINL